MTVREYLYQSELSEKQLAQLLGYKSTTPVTKRLDEDMPERWTRRLDEMADLGITAETVDKADDNSEESERESKITDESINEWISGDGRDGDKDPRINSGDAVIGPQQIKLSTIEGYIKMVYEGAEALARSKGDAIAADTIHAYTPQYTDAWIEYIKCDPRILRYLEQLNIGTPIGNLIGIHAISVGAYALARITAREIAANAAANTNGSGEVEL